MHKEITEAKKNYLHAQDCYLHVVQRVQSSCKHNDCVISECTLQTYTNGCGMGVSSIGRRPFKVCKDCGYAECDWHGPDLISRKGLPKVSVEEADKHRTGPIHERD